jgi:hypothetical protein
MYLLNKVGRSAVRSSPLLNEVREWRNGIGVGDSIGQVLPKGDPELSTGPLQAHEGIPTALPQVTSGPATDLAFLDGIAKIPFTPIGVQRNVWPLQHQQQLRFGALDPSKCLVQGLKARLGGEESIKVGFPGRFSSRAKDVPCRPSAQHIAPRAECAPRRVLAGASG